MSAENGPLFVERRTYRRRRLVDATRLLPIFGVALVCLPLLWTGAEEEPTSTTYAMIYFFGLWLVLVLGAALLFRYLNTSSEDAGAGQGTAQAGDDLTASGSGQDDTHEVADHGTAGGPGWQR